LEPSNLSSEWLAAVIERHTRAMSRPEFLKAVRALSARYVERRASLPNRAPADSAGKRAAFAGFFAPLHFLTARAIVEAVGAGRPDLDRVHDLGCGTGVAGAAWALACGSRPALAGLDRQKWMLDEARWNWRALGLTGRALRGDLVASAARLAADARVSRRDGVVLAWSVNELNALQRSAVLSALGVLAGRGVAVLVIEPLSHAAVPWWDPWVATLGGRTETWKFDAIMPASLEALDAEAGFRREHLAARSLWIG
jgi:hypothetical protein